MILVTLYIHNGFETLGFFASLSSQLLSITPKHSFFLFVLFLCLFLGTYGETKSCHSATRVSWDMQGLLFVLETEKLYLGYSWASALSMFFFQDPVCLFQLFANTQECPKTPANKISRYWISQLNLYF